MTKKLRIVLGQLNLTVGDIDGNLTKHLEAAATARDQLHADVIVFPELSITGYSPQDLLLRRAFITDAKAALEKLQREIKGIHCLIGHPHATESGLHNACSLIYNGKLLACYSKQWLPNENVFDEHRYFNPGKSACVVPIHDVPVGLIICEDLWKMEPTRQAAEHGAQLILSPNASPFEVEKHAQRQHVLANCAQLNRVPIVYVNHVGGEDELLFDGGSMVVDEQGKVCQFAGFFKETLFPVDIDVSATPKIVTKDFTLPATTEKIYHALVLSLRDYVLKNGFRSVLVGVSGGIDSALTLALAVDALGSEAVHAVIMPSRHTGAISLEDAKLLVAALKVKSETISIETTYTSLLSTLQPYFADREMDVTEENMQARCRGVILMALSNKFGHLVLSTGNRSELAVGYCTLYGDMVGGFAVLKNVPKMQVYELARYRNQDQMVIPERTLKRAPTAELAPDQKDQDSLPPYPELDRILECYIDKEQSQEEIIAQGFSADVVMRMITLLNKNQYKRQQAPIGPHINPQSFGKDWRYPLTNKWKG